MTMTHRSNMFRVEPMKLLVAVMMLLVPAAAAQPGDPAAMVGAVPASGSLGSFVGLQGVYIRPLEPLGTQYGGASGFYGAYGLHFPEQYVLIIQGGYTGYGEYLNPADGGVEQLHVVHVIAGPRLYLETDGVMPFLYLGVGMNFINEMYLDNGQPVDETGVYFAWQFGLGLTIPVVGPLALDFQAKYNNSFFNYGQGHDNPENRMLTGFEYTGGVNWFFGR
jgi:hypothetical protein